MQNQNNNLIPPHGGYRNLKSYQTAELIYDLTVEFCKLYIDRSNRSDGSYRMADQMVQAARSGKQNIAEGTNEILSRSSASGTSKKTEIKLINVARSSLEELLLDYQDYLRQHALRLWDKENPKAREVRELAYRSNRTYKTYEPYLAKPDMAANAIICLIHQANYLLDRQLSSLGQEFLEKGGFTENLFKKRDQERKKILGRWPGD